MDATATTVRTWPRAVLDWLPVVAIVAAYGVLHALADTMTPGAHVQPQLGFDEWVFGGVAPTVRLQRELWDPGNPHWYDYATWLVYLSHFVVTLTVAIFLWILDYPAFRKFRVLIVTVTFAGFATYLAYPAIPPWLASVRGDMPHTVRVVKEMWAHLGLGDVAAVFGEKSRYAFPVGALPSLHAAWPFMITLFFWPRAGRWRILLVAYTIAMAFTLVYTADHFVFDILLGWIYATIVYVIARSIWRRRIAYTTTE
jgi:PAP2 superfamily